MSESAQIKLLAEFTEGTWTDIWEDVRISEGWNLRWGNQQTGPVDLIGQTGILGFTLDNSAFNSAGTVGLYSPAHASVRSGFAKGLPLRLLVSHGSNKMGSKKFGADGALIYSLASPPSITPTLGAEKLTNGGFETAGGGGDDVFASWAEHKSNGVIADELAIVYSGSHACKFTTGAASDIYISPSTSPVVVPGQTYQFIFWTRGDGTNAGRYSVADATHWVNIIPTTSTGIPGTTYTQLTITFTAPAGCFKAHPYVWGPSVNGGIAYFDDVSVKPVTVESFGSLQTGAVNVSVSANLTIPANLQGGVVLALDSAVTPANFILAYYNRYLGKVIVDQYIADALTNLLSETVAYVAGATLKAIKANGWVTVYYNGALVGSAVKVTESAYTLCGLFATDVSVTFANLAIYNLATFDDMYEMFNGNLAAAEPKMGLYGERTTACEWRDWFDVAARNVIGTLPAQLNKRVDEILPEILSKSSKQPPRVYTHTGKTVFPQSMDAEFGQKTKIMTALSKLALSEVGHIYMRGGTLAERYALWQEDRQYRFNNQTSIITLDNTMDDLPVRYSNDEVWNSVRVSVYPRRIDTTPTTVVAAIEKEIYLLPGETKTITLEYRDPSNESSKITAIEVQAPVAGTDYHFGRAEVETGTGGMTDSLGLTYEAGASVVKVTLTNNATVGGWVSGLQFKAKGVYLFQPVTVDKISQSSANATGDMQKTIDLPYETRERFAEALAAYVLALQDDWQEKVSGVSFLANRDASHMIAALSGQPGKCFTLTETVTGVSKLFVITGCELKGEPGDIIRCSWACAPADTTAYWRMGISAMQTETIMGPI